MKALTLTDYIDRKIKSDAQFAEHFASEQIINNIAEMIVDARQTVHTTQSDLSTIGSGDSPYISSLETVKRKQS